MNNSAAEVVRKIRRVRRIQLPENPPDSAVTRAVTAEKIQSETRTAKPLEPEPPVLKVGFIPGVEPDVFVRRWHQDANRPKMQLVPIEFEYQESALTSGETDLVFARLPLSTQLAAKTYAVKLWEEKPVAVFSTDNNLALYEELQAEDLAEEPEFTESAGSLKERIEIVASGIGYTVMPMSLARFHHRKDVTYRVLADEAGTHIALTWLKANDSGLFQEFVAVVRGRTTKSSRG